MGSEAQEDDVTTTPTIEVRGNCARRMCGMSAGVEDFMHDTLTALHLQLGAHDTEGPATSWGQGIASRRPYSPWLERDRGARLFESLDELPGEPHPQHHEGVSVQHDQKQPPGNLSAAQRRATVKSQVDGRLIADAARRAGSSESAIKIYLRRGRQLLAKLIRETP